MIGRKFAMRRLKRGDYLLPSNDERTIWRIAKYTEEGSLERALPNGGYEKIVGTFWGVWRYIGRGPVDPNEWNDFDMFDALLKSRAQAIETALKASAVYSETHVTVKNGRVV